MFCNELIFIITSPIVLQFVLFFGIIQNLESYCHVCVLLPCVPRWSMSSDNSGEGLHRISKDIIRGKVVAKNLMTPFDRLGHQWTGIWFPARARDLSLLHCPQCT